MKNLIIVFVVIMFESCSFTFEVKQPEQRIYMQRDTAIKDYNWTNEADAKWHFIDTTKQKKQ
jgi:hypothetical protein